MKTFLKLLVFAFVALAIAGSAWGGMFTMGDNMGDCRARRDTYTQGYNLHTSSVVVWGLDGTSSGTFYIDHWGALNIRKNAQNVIQINPDGTVSIFGGNSGIQWGVTGLRPVSDAVQPLGLSDKRFVYMFISSKTITGGQGSASTATATGLTCPADGYRFNGGEYTFVSTANVSIIVFPDGTYFTTTATIAGVDPGRYMQNPATATLNMYGYGLMALLNLIGTESGNSIWFNDASGLHLVAPDGTVIYSTAVAGSLRSTHTLTRWDFPTGYQINVSTINLALLRFSDGTVLISTAGLGGGGWAGNATTNLEMNQYQVNFGSNPVLPLAKIRLPAESSGTLVGRNWYGTGPLAIWAGNGKVYVASYNGQRIDCWNVTIATAPQLVSSVNVGSAMECLDVQGDYVYVATQGNGIYVYDFSDADNPVLAGSTTNVTSAGISGIKVYGNIAWTENSNAWDLWDVSKSTPVQIYRHTYGSDRECNDADFEGRFLYIADNGSSLFRWADVRNPYAPTVGEYNLGFTCGWVAAQGNWVYCTDNNTGFYVVDVTTPTAPTLAGTLSIAGESLRRPTVSGKFVYVPGANYIYVIDVSTPQAPRLWGTIYEGSAVYQVAIVGRYLYAIGYGSAYMAVYDLGGGYVQNLEAGHVSAVDVDVMRGMRVQGTVDAGVVNARDGLHAGGKSYLDDVAIGSAAIGNLNFDTAYTVYAEDFILPSINFPALKKDEYNVAGASVPYYDLSYSPDTDQRAVKSIGYFDSRYDGSGITAYVVYYTTYDASAQGVTWRVMSSTSSNYSNLTWYSSSATFSGPSTAYDVVAATIAIPTANLPVPGKPFRFSVARNATNGADTAAGNAEVVYVHIAYRRR